MAEEGAKWWTVSSRGSFFIGLVLGLGLGCIYAFWQNECFVNERLSLKRANQRLTEQVVEARGALTAKETAAKK